MDSHKKKYFKDSIRFESTMASLYFTYAKAFAEDHLFWTELALEEEKHASIFKNGYAELYDKGLFPERLLKSNSRTANLYIHKIQQVINRVNSLPVSKEKAYYFALQMEHQCIELLFEIIAVKTIDSRDERLFQNMVDESKGHIARIESIMDRYGFGHEVSIDSELVIP